MDFFAAACGRFSIGANRGFYRQRALSVDRVFVRAVDEVARLCKLFASGTAVGGNDAGVRIELWTFRDAAVLGEHWGGIQLDPRRVDAGGARDFWDYAVDCAAIARVSGMKRLGARRDNQPGMRLTLGEKREQGSRTPYGT